ncbi:PREDICTED: transmembrane and coiled-coil domain-containing protein 5B-like [Chinchilla lanigera]|uniref:Transmembrane and coiled-coil domain-containing protein 5B-like n=1 Tax=Chinchilla lanigera TaxID=34839 RepID=A0A8C2VAH7_CHILA|nr:PREDICTED: transmembrane and coiled-coil domain-containing protein 5B-like [Chinchilla lanigera]
MEEVEQNPLGDTLMMEIANLEATKQNLDRLNSDLEKDLQTLDEANEALLRKIQEKEKVIQSLERDLTLSSERDEEKEELNQIISEREEALNDLEVETAKLEEKNAILNKNVGELQEKISRGFKNAGPTKEILKQNLAELKVKLQQSTESCAQQEEEIAKVKSDYLFIQERCEDQAHCIKMYQEALRRLEKEKEVLMLNKEIAKAQKNSSQLVKPGSVLVETIQNNMEKTIIKKQKRVSFFRFFRWLFFMILIFIELLGYLFFHLQYINPDLIVETLPLLMSRSNLKRLRDFLSPLLTFEGDCLLPH